ncbi:MAG: helix-turn-helix domain-containing protein [Clostridiales bacterium]|jgi:hypothetical protein|nr:helix-turn-helix domain-containing protein [Clostridiales bacterium]
MSEKKIGKPRGFTTDIPVETIRKELSGDKAAMEQVLETYEPYITQQATLDKGKPG